jgi:hypothetical protein
MKPRQTETDNDDRCWVSDNKEGKDSGTESKRKLSQGKQDLSPVWWRRVMQSLPRLRVRSERQWSIGQQCLVMTGKSGIDEGQVAVVTDRKPYMVEIAFRGPDGKIRRKMKRSCSLIGLRPGVVIVQDADGTTWVQPEIKIEKKEEEWE